jgi:hypothetical protein
MNFNIWTAEVNYLNPTPPPPSSPFGGQGLQIKSFLADKRGKYKGKKEVAATVLIKTIKYYENTKYILKKGKYSVYIIYIY